MLTALAGGGSLAGRVVVELGAGTGAVTELLLAAAARVVAVERDRELAALLRARLSGHGQLAVREADAARVDLAALASSAGAQGPLAVIGNLPYQLASRIVVHLAAQARQLTAAVVMVQREVAERMCAAAGTRPFSLLSVLVQRSLMARRLFDVPAGAFHPRPKVTSSVVLLIPAGRALDDPDLVQAARWCFSGRRRTLARVLADRSGRGRDEAAGWAVAAGLDPGARAETVPLAGFAALGAVLRAHALLPAGLPGPR